MIIRNSHLVGHCNKQRVRTTAEMLKRSICLAGCGLMSYICISLKTDAMTTGKFVLTMLCLMLLPAMCAGATLTDNIVIENKTDVYKFVASKDGSKLDRVEHSSEITFRANKSEGTAKTLAYYCDHIKMGKASGGTTDYVPYFSDDVFFSDSKACRINAQIKKAGGKAKVTYKRTLTKPEFLTKIYLPDEQYIEQATIQFIIPLSLASRYDIEAVNLQADKYEKSVTEKGDERVITFTVSDIKTPEYFSDAPSMNITMPKLRVRGHFADHNELYRYLLGYITPTDPGEEAVKAKAKEITAGCRTDMERIAAVNDYVHSSIRYVAVEHGEFSHRPDLPSEVLRKLYGDCKCSAGLIRALLRAVGIDARYVWIGTNSIADDWTDVPSLASGNHMIAAVVMPDTVMFLDGTASHNGVHSIPTAIQGQQAMIEDSPEKCMIRRVPVLPAETNMWRERIDLHLLPSGDMDVEGALSFTGAVRNSYAYMTDAVLPGKLQELYASTFEESVKGCRATSASCEMTDSVISISGKGSVSGKISSAGNEAFVDLNPMPSIASMKFEMKNRNVDGRFQSRKMYDIIHTLHLPEGYIAGSMPKDESIDNEWIQAEIKSIPSPDGKSIERRFMLKIKQLDVPLDQLESVNADIHRLARATTAKIGLLKTK